MMTKEELARLEHAYEELEAETLVRARKEVREGNARAAARLINALARLGRARKKKTR